MPGVDKSTFSYELVEQVPMVAPPSSHHSCLHSCLHSSSLHPYLPSSLHPYLPSSLHPYPPSSHHSSLHPYHRGSLAGSLDRHPRSPLGQHCSASNQQEQVKCFGRAYVQQPQPPHAPRVPFPSAHTPLPHHQHQELTYHCIAVFCHSIPYWPA